MTTIYVGIHRIVCESTGAAAPKRKSEGFFEKFLKNPKKA